MTETGKKAKSSKSAAAKRDAYDDFLDGDRDGTKKKSASSKTRKSSQSAVEPGIAMPPSTKKAGTAKQPASAAKKSSSNRSSSAKKAKIEENPLARASRTEYDRSRYRSEAGTSRPVRRAETEADLPRSRAGSAPHHSANTPRPARRSRRAVLAVDNRDPFDDYLQHTEEMSRPHRRKKKTSSVTVLLATAIVVLLGLGGYQAVRYRAFAEMKSAVQRETFYEGTTVEGIDVSSMTLAQAMEYWQENIEPAYSQREVTLSNGASFTAEELGYTSDYATVLSNAFSAGRTGSLEQRYALLSSRRSAPVSYSVTRQSYDPAAIARCVSQIAEAIDRPAENAKIASFDTESYEFTFTDAVTGSQLDADALTRDMTQAMENGGGSVELSVLAIQPDVTQSDIASQYGLIASAVTNASSSSSNRLSNIRLALQMINGTCLKPGETFSFNETVGKRTTDRGFKMATAYSSGTVVEDVGGGICQVSTTLFNAAVKADLQIVERHNHSLTVAYVDRGKDAAVNWNSQDLRFTNNSDDNVYICCFLSDDKRVRVGVFGKLLPNGESIAIESEVTGTTSFETVYQPNLTLATGASQVTQKGKDGCSAVAYKVRKDASGNTISREELCRSSYKTVNQIVEYGP